MAACRLPRWSQQQLLTSSGSTCSGWPPSVARFAGPVMTSLNWVGGMGLSSSNTTLPTSRSRVGLQSLETVGADGDEDNQVQIAGQLRDQAQKLVGFIARVRGEQFFGLIQR